MDSLNGIVAFVQVAEQLSFVSAARGLGISASAVGKSIARLEASVGARLFQRTTRRVALTAEGAAFYARCRHILDELREAEAMLAQAQRSPRGRLRIGVPTIGYRFLLPVIPEFHRRYPDIELDLDCNDRLVDLLEDGVDAVIRSGELSDSSLKSRRLGTFRFLLCAAPAYLQQRGTPQIPSELAQHDCLRFRFPHSERLQRWPLRDAAGVDPLHGTSPLTCNNMEALRSAAIAGLGIVCMPDFLARDAVADGRLCRVLNGYLADAGQFSILWPCSRLLSPRLRVFIDFVAQTLFQDEADTVST